MIGKPEWFKRRKYSGWGVTPKTWQGWLYLALVLLPFAIFQIIPIWSPLTRTIVTIVWALILCIDIIDIMIRMKKDEREKIHEAIAERNALWTIMFILVIGVGYQVAKSSVLKDFSQFDWFLIIALFAGLIAKSITNFYLEKKN